MIDIVPSPTADTRTCDYTTVTKETLLASSHQHIRDVREALQFFSRVLAQALLAHDTDKITDLDGFHRDFVTGFTVTDWWDRHRRLNRHHLTEADGVPEDVNLIDVLDFIADCVMAGMARSGSVYPLHLPPELLERAFQNTVDLLTRQIRVIPPTKETVMPTPRDPAHEPGTPQKPEEAPGHPDPGKPEKPEKPDQAGPKPKPKPPMVEPEPPVVTPRRTTNGGADLVDVVDVHE